MALWCLWPVQATPTAPWEPCYGPTAQAGPFKGRYCLAHASRLPIWPSKQAPAGACLALGHVHAGANMRLLCIVCNSTKKNLLDGEYLKHCHSVVKHHAIL
jgi:hypothetical protein